MHGISRSRDYDRRFWEGTLPILEGYAEFNHYNFWVPAEELFDLAITTMGLRNGHPVRKYSYLSEGDDLSYYAFRRPKWWQRGVVSFRPYYTGSATLGGFTFALAAKITASQEGKILVNPTGMTYAIATAPTAAGTLFIDRQFEGFQGNNTALTVGQDKDIICIAFGRNAANKDDNAAIDLELLGLEVFYRELRREGGANYKKDYSWVQKP